MRSAHRSSYNTRLALTGLGALAVVASLGGGASHAPAVDAATNRPSRLSQTVDARTIREVDFGEVAQPGSACSEGLRFAPPGAIPVAEGQSQVLDLGRLTRLSVDADVAVGDVTGDGVDDAVVPLRCSFGANGVEESLHVWSLQRGRLTHVASIDGAPTSVDDPLGATLHGVAVTDEGLTVTWLVHADDDARCCPTQQASVVYELDGEALEPAGDPVIRTTGPALA